MTVVRRCPLPLQLELLLDEELDDDDDVPPVLLDVDALLSFDPLLLLLSLDGFDSDAVVDDAVEDDSFFPGFTDE